MTTTLPLKFDSNKSVLSRTDTIFSDKVSVKQQGISLGGGQNSSSDRLPLSLGIHQLFEACAAKTPDASAVTFQRQLLSYDTLNKKANQLAHALITQGIGPGSLVAVSMPRTPEVIVAILGVLKAGAAYVPIDPAYPAQRRNYILQDSKVAAIITHPTLAESLSASLSHSSYLNPSIIQLDAEGTEVAQQSNTNPNITITPENLAYIIYTSGSTGNPKGVMVKHQGVVNHALATVAEFEITSTDRVLQFSSLSFDIVVEEIYPTLISGATLVLRSEEIAISLSAFLDFTVSENITVLNLPTAFWHELVTVLVRRARRQPPAKASTTSGTQLSKTVRLVIVGGEKASRAIYTQWYDLMGEYPRWLNTYGPTEATVTSTVYDPISESFDRNQELPIGRPIANVKTYVLNESMQPVAPGDAGELFIGGLGLARGYLNLPEKTAKAFVFVLPEQLSQLVEKQSPVPDNRLYRTGDIVRELPDGNLAFVGRADFQVKIRGFRIELGEIEACLETHSKVQQQIVIAHEKAAGEKQLVAYIVLTETSTDQHEHHAIQCDIQAFLRKTLPEYMIPSTFIFLEALPITPNGKVDRKALPAPLEQQRTLEVVTPRTGLEKTLVDIWKTVLDVGSVGIDDNFFELGGSSLKAVHLFSLIEEQLNQKIPLATMLQAPTITHLAKALSQDSHAELWDTLVPMRTGGSKPPLFFLHAVGPSILTYQNLLPYLDPDQPVYAIQAKGLDESQPLIERMDLMASEYIEDVKKLQPEGPYYLVGHSFGGMMAFEMAQQLCDQGETVGLLGLIDTAVPALSYCQTPPWIYQLYVHVLNCIQAPGIQRKWQYFASRVQPIGQKLFSRKNQPQELEQELLPEIYRRIETIDREALKRYSPRVYPETMTLFRAQEKDPKQVYDDYLGWRYLVEGGLNIHDVPGNHFSLMFEPHVEILAAKLQKCLNQAYTDVTKSL